MTPGARKAMYLACLHGASRAIAYEHAPKWGNTAARALSDARAALASAIMGLGEVTPLPDAPPVILRSEVEAVALSLAVMAADALHPDRPTPDDAALAGVVSTLRHALAEIAKEQV